MSRLKKVYGSNWTFTPLPIVNDSNGRREPGCILERRMVKRGNQAAAQLLIQWKGGSVEEATWEFASEIRRRFPEFSLEDKGSKEGRSCYEEVGAEGVAEGLA